MGETATRPPAYRSIRPGTPAALILDLVRSMRGNVKAIEGEAALGLAHLLHWAGLDSRGQWGNAYFRCPECEGARDCTGEETWGDSDWDGLPLCGNERERGVYCQHQFTTADLRLSEGWVDRDVCGVAFGASCRKVREGVARAD